MTETPVLFGTDTSLVGVLTRPDSITSSAVAYLMFNAGVLARIGPHRLHVKLARSLAEAGESSLRFDLSGQGDSRSAMTGSDYRAQAVRDIRDAMDHLESRFGFRHFALIGICSGAVNSFAAAREDTRIVGVLMFDGHNYSSRWSRPVRHWKRFRATGWASATAGLRRRLTALLRSDAAPGREELVEQADPSANPPRAEFARALQGLVDRSVAVFLIYSGTVIDYYSYANQFRDVFGREAFFRHVRCELHTAIDHTLISLEAQRRMITVVRDWTADVRRASDAQR